MIPMLLHYDLETSGATGANTNAGLTIRALGLNFSKNAVNGQAFKGTLSFNSSAFDMISIGVSASASASYEDVYNDDLGRVEREGRGAFAVADPFLFVDPNWEYARYVLVEQESILHLGEWVEVTRVWQNPPNNAVPEPSTMLLLGSGLIGLWGARKKFKK